MKSPSLSPGVDLPLTGREVLEKAPDWIGLWEILAGQGPAVFLESGGPAGEASQWHLLAGGLEMEFSGSGGQGRLNRGPGLEPESLAFPEFIDGIGRPETTFAPLPFCLSQAWFGLLSYEFGRPPAAGPRGDAAQEGESPSRPPTPEFYFFKPRFAMALHRQSKECFWFGEAPAGLLRPGETRGKHFRVGEVRPGSSREHYETMVRKAKDYISRGDIYQANLAQSFHASWKGNPADLYRVLREVNPGPFMGIFRGRGFTVVSSSPERLAAGSGDWLETRPIAGTRPRSRDEREDLQLQWELKSSPKEQAEHLMLVDLARNDLGRVSRYGTVEVRRYAEVESYARVHHLVSRIEGVRKPAAGFSQILESVFPGGTITGCPKVRCMQVIGELEQKPRGFYTGSMGYVAPGPKFDLNILIRSFTLLDGGPLEFYAGAGIVADSNPAGEYMETLYKVEALAQALGTTLLK